jgi:hypothetical protein
MATMSDDKTLTMTWTLHLKEPLTDKEKDTIIGNLYEHLWEQRHCNIPGFVKIDEVVPPDGKYRVSIRDLLGTVEAALQAEGVPVVDTKRDDEWR